MLFCRKPLPVPQKGVHLATELDNLLATYRQIELESLIEMATNLRENATDINEALSEAENFLQILRNLAVEVKYTHSTNVCGTVLRVQVTSMYGTCYCGTFFMVQYFMVQVFFVIQVFAVLLYKFL